MQNQAVVPGLTQVAKPVKEVDKSLDSFVAYYDDKDEVTAKRREECADVANLFYNLVTDFYEYGWGQGFHFCPMRKEETFEQSMAKYQYYIALKLGLKPGTKCLDVGCGVGGPGRSIASFSGATVVGININKYQLKRCEFLTRECGLDHLCKFIEGDYNDMKISPNSLDAAFAVEATVYSKNKEVYGEVFKVLKPGAQFASYEWVLTDKYDPSNKEHVRLKNGIMIGNGLPEIQTSDEAVASMKKAGFKIIEAYDVSNTGNLPWYYSLQGRWTLQNFKSTPLGMFMTHCLLVAMETLRFAPQGSVKVQNVLVQAAKDLRAAGELGIFAPCFLVVAEKPANWDIKL